MRREEHVLAYLDENEVLQCRICIGSSMYKNDINNFRERFHEHVLEVYYSYDNYNKRECCVRFTTNLYRTFKFDNKKHVPILTTQSCKLCKTSLRRCGGIMSNCPYNILSIIDIYKNHVHLMIKEE